MINKNIAAFCAAFERELGKSNDIENAIELACGYDFRNIDDYDA